MPVAALVAAGALFELSENRVRVAVARLLASGRLERDERGRYRLGAGAVPVDRRVRSWRRLEERTRRWDGGWIAVHGAPRGREGRRGARALRLLGFASLARDLVVRPDNLRGGVPQVRAELRELGLEPDALVFGLRELDLAGEARARRLWDAAALRAGHARSRAEVERSAEHLGRLPAERAMAESFLLGGRVIRQLVLDPLLPDPILPVAERDALVEAMRRYDRLGRACWAGFLERHGVLGSRAPADTRIPDGATRLLN